MSVLQEQLERLKEFYPDATSKDIGEGRFLITVPGIRLPSGWNSNVVEVCFVVPQAYPLANPDCFFADEGLRLRGGGMPKNSALQSQPYLPGQRMWFSWHFQGWNANRDSLFTYVKLIQDRLKRVE
jgi:hypothetical protein